MKTENKIALEEVHKRLDQRTGEHVSKKMFEDLLWCWRRHAHKTRAGKDGWLSQRNTTDFLKYAY